MRKKAKKEKVNQFCTFYSYRNEMQKKEISKKINRKTSLRLSISFFKTSNNNLCNNIGLNLLK